MAEAHARRDLAIVGGGIVGLATAWTLARRFPAVSLTVLEAEPRLGAHQTGHNSGVIHSGLYYKPGSLKARLCVSGREALVRFCEEHDIPFDICGKVVVATDGDEKKTLDVLQKRGVANGLRGLERLDEAGLREREPHVRGVGGLLVPETGIVDYGRVAAKLGELLAAAGHEVRTSTRVTGIDEDEDGLTIDTGSGTFRSRYLVNCAGLQSDRVARMCGARPGVRIVPFRGEYYELAEHRRSLVRNLIYPVPDPRFPFLGVHFTRMIGGGVEAGPNAVLAFRREGYRRNSFSLRDTLGTLLYPGFWKLAAKYGRTGLAEFARSWNKRLFVRSLQRLVPDVRGADLCPGGAGVRAQAIEPTGGLVDDFRVVETGRAVHVLNAPSPAATASLAIGDHIGAVARERFGLG